MVKTKEQEFQHALFDIMRTLLTRGENQEEQSYIHIYRKEEKRTDPPTIPTETILDESPKLGVKSLALTFASCGSTTVDDLSSLERRSMGSVKDKERLEG